MWHLAEHAPDIDSDIEHGQWQTCDESRKSICCANAKPFEKKVIYLMRGSSPTQADHFFLVLLRNMCVADIATQLTASKKDETHGESSSRSVSGSVFFIFVFVFFCLFLETCCEDVH